MVLIGQTRMSGKFVIYDHSELYCLWHQNIIFASPHGPRLQFDRHPLSVRCSMLYSGLRWRISKVKKRHTHFTPLKCILCPVRTDADPYGVGDRSSFPISCPDAAHQAFFHLQRPLKRLIKVGHAVLYLNKNIVSISFSMAQDPFHQVRSPHIDNPVPKNGCQVIYPEPRGCLPQREWMHIWCFPGKGRPLQQPIHARLVTGFWYRDVRASIPRPRPYQPHLFTQIRSGISGAGTCLCLSCVPSGLDSFGTAAHFEGSGSLPMEAS